MSEIADSVLGYQQQHTDQQYLRYDPFEGDRDISIEFQKTSIVTTRATHRCAAGDLIRQAHEIPPGTRCRKESAKVDGSVGSCWCCLECLDKLREDDGFCWVCGTEHAIAARPEGGAG